MECASATRFHCDKRTIAKTIGTFIAILIQTHAIIIDYATRFGIRKFGKLLNVAILPSFLQFFTEFLTALIINLILKILPNTINIFCIFGILTYDIYSKTLYSTVVVGSSKIPCYSKTVLILLVV